MEPLDLDNLDSLNKIFCDTVGIKPIKAALINVDTGEIRTYESKSSIYKPPKDWKNIQPVLFENPVYPDFTDPYNFMMLMELHWDMFNSLGGQYDRIKNESFTVNFLFNKIRAIQTMKMYGGSEVLDEFIHTIQNLDLEYPIEVLECSA